MQTYLLAKHVSLVTECGQIVIINNLLARRVILIVYHVKERGKLALNVWKTFMSILKVLAVRDLIIVQFSLLQMDNVLCVIMDPD